MVSVPVRIPKETIEDLKELASAQNMSVGKYIAQLVEAQKREQFWVALEQAALKARNDPETWQEMQEEQAIWDGTLNDGLE